MTEAILNALTVDVEEYFQVHNFDGRVHRDEGEKYGSRVESRTERVLEILDETATNATFFFLGWVAERHAGLVRSIRESGHEIATDGYDH